MKAIASAENTKRSIEKAPHCSECGWPGIGQMPTGVRMISANGKRLLIGHLSYYPVVGTLCSLCKEMESALNDRPWFIEAHSEYVDEIKTKKRFKRKLKLVCK